MRNLLARCVRRPAFRTQKSCSPRGIFVDWISLITDYYALYGLFFCPEMIPLQLQTRIGALCVCVSEAIGHPSLSASLHFCCCCRQILQSPPSFFVSWLLGTFGWPITNQTSSSLFHREEKLNAKKEEEEMAVRGRRVAPTTGASLVV